MTDLNFSGPDLGANSGWITCVGETMVQAVPVSPGWIDKDSILSLGAAGAEANVARYLARHNLDARVAGKIGRDPFGDIVRGVLEDDHVNIADLDRDGTRPTAVYFKEYDGATSRVHYYRKGSAASAMGPEFALRPVVTDAALIHVTGILPALSDSCRQLTIALFDERSSQGLRSFDINWRPSLWTEPSPVVLLECARRADIAFVGLDEAKTLWGVSKPTDIRELLPGPSHVVVKLGSEGAVAFHNGESTFAPALAVNVVEEVGAGDAFAAGYIAGLFYSRSVEHCLRMGSITAAAALQVSQDVGPLPHASEMERLINLPPSEWSGASLQAADSA